MVTRVVTGGATAFDFDITGDVALEPVKADERSAVLVATMSSVEVTTRGSSGADRLAQLSSELERAAYLVSFEGGRLAEIGVPRGATAMAANVHREIAAGLQFVRSASDLQSYTMDEYDTTGHYVAAYDAREQSGAWRKHKLRYTAILGDQRPTIPVTTARAAIVPGVVSSEGNVRLSDSGRPVHVDASDQLVIAGAQTPVRSATELTLDARDELPRDSRSLDLSALLASVVTVAADQPYAAPAADALDDARIHGLTFEKVVRELEKLDAVAGGRPGLGSVNGHELSADDRETGNRITKERADLFIALAAILRRQPATVQQAVKLIRDGSPAQTTLISALGSASGPESEAALIELMHDGSLSAELRSRATHALARGARPTDAAVGALREILASAPYNMQALYGLGTMGRHLREQGRADAAASIGDYLIQRFDAAPNASVRMIVMTAIGNTGYGPALPRVLAGAKDGVESVRVAAVEALRSMEEPSVDGWLASFIEGDASDKVRMAGIDSASVRKPSDRLVTALVRAAANASDAHVRYRAVDLMVRWAPQRPDLIEPLRSVARSDSEAQVRGRAQSAL